MNRESAEDVMFKVKGMQVSGPTSEIKKLTASQKPEAYFRLRALGSLVAGFAETLKHMERHERHAPPERAERRERPPPPEKRAPRKRAAPKKKKEPAAENVAVAPKKRAPRKAPAPKKAVRRKREPDPPMGVEL